jgi:flagellar biosynthetic protein FliR
VMPELLGNLNIALVVFVRVMAMCMVAPLLSSGSIPGIARAGLALFITTAVYPQVAQSGYALPPTDGQYILILVGEALVGVIIGLYLLVIFAIFQVAGEFFSVQMGLGASEVFDPLAQVEIPLMGQFLYLISMLVFLQVDGFQQLLIGGLLRSFETLKAVDLVGGRDALFQYFVGCLGRLFESALTISFPILGTLLLVSVSLGLLAKAAPQMNLLSLGFSISDAVAFTVLLLVVPYLMSAFGGILNSAFEGLSRLVEGIALSAGGAK